MNTPALLSGLGSSGAAALLFRMAKKELVNKKQAAKLKMTRINDIKNGLCLTAGEVVCDTPIETPYTSTPAVWYRYGASERRMRKKESGYYDYPLTSGNRSCAFSLRDSNGQIEIVPDGGKVISYPHMRIFKSGSGSRTALGDRIKKLKASDQENYPDGRKKPFFRKLDMADEPLDIPDDLVELTPGSSEAKNAHRKYSEHWVCPGDYVYMLGTASTGGSGSPMMIAKGGKSGPLFLSADAQDLTAKAFQSNAMVLLLVSFGLGLLGIFLALMGLGVID